jgi:hypothetical protein
MKIALNPLKKITECGVGGEECGGGWVREIEFSIHYSQKKLI